MYTYIYYVVCNMHTNYICVRLQIKGKIKMKPFLKYGRNRNYFEIVNF